MNRSLRTLALGLLAAAVLTLVVPTAAQAQVVIVQSPSITPAPPVITATYSAPLYVAPSISYYPPVVTTTYAVPRVAYYPAPVVTTYSPVPAVVAPSPGVYTTYTYRNGLGVFRPRFVNQTYYTPLP
jgi:hypothetical protein